MAVGERKRPDSVGAFLHDVERLIERQLQDNPGSIDLRLRLLEVYFETRRPAEYLREARNLGHLVHAKSESLDWQRVVAMGRALRPDEPLFGGGNGHGGASADAHPVLQISPASMRRFGESDDHRPYFEQLARTYEKLAADPSFLSDLDLELMQTANKPSSLFRARRLSHQVGGAQIFIKREDLSPPYVHLTIAVTGQILWAQRMGKTTVITAAVEIQQGVLTATIAARHGLRSVVYVDKEQAQMHQNQVLRMRLAGAAVHVLESAAFPGGDLRYAALDQWIKQTSTAFLVLGMDGGPHPYPSLGRDFSASIGRECRRQIMVQARKLPELMVARGGNNADALGLFYPFLTEAATRLVCVNPHKDFNPPPPAADPPPAGNGTADGGADGSPDLHKLMERVILESKSYSSLRREHSWLRAAGRVDYQDTTAKEALDALITLMRCEGILCSIETAYSFGWALSAARRMKTDDVIVVMMAERPDKDIYEISRVATPLLN
ncbi:MAG: pyridoxal-phosphate dependent enzyme [Gammaproteobacteria bacterium]|nr:pyridoxal-phosphate dependent enzyme [Gammaproteobacteria bacterium]